MEKCSVSFAADHEDGGSVSGNEEAVQHDHDPRSRNQQPWREI